MNIDYEVGTVGTKSASEAASTGKTPIQGQEFIMGTVILQM